MHLVYLIESQKTHEWYIGYTANLKKRLSSHNNNKNKSTANKGPWKLIYCEAYIEKKDALGREKFLKSGAGWRFLKKQIKHYIALQGELVEVE